MASMPTSVARSPLELIGHTPVVRLNRIPGTAAPRGMHGAIAKAEELVRNNPGYFMPQQFSNPANPEIHYKTTGPELVEQLDRIDAFVAGVGTGGTISGTGRYLREKLANRPLIVAVEPKN